MGRKVSKINAIPRLPSFGNNIESKRKVAAYARVSTGSMEQENSLEAQVDYFQRFIQEHNTWHYIGIYTDDGISGVSAKKRDGFNKMIQDALGGKIDLIVTKSLSRFARNTVDSLVTIRKLKAANVEVYFQKEDIYTFDAKGEFLLTLLSSFAQEESRSISENVTWGYRKRFSEGIYRVSEKLMGYHTDHKAEPVIVEEEAAIVRKIYRLFLEGETSHSICKILENEKIPSPQGNQKWYTSTVENILTNERYAGDARLQKTYTIDYLTKKTKVNEGELPQYYVRDGHPAIISHEIFEAVADIIEHRKSLKKVYSSNTVYSMKLICNDCGSLFGRKIAHSNDKYRHYFWRCNHFYENHCRTGTINETILKKAFTDALRYLYSYYPQVIDDLTNILHISLSQERAANCIEHLSELSEEVWQDDLSWKILIESVIVTADNILLFRFIDKTLCEILYDKKHKETKISPQALN